MNTNLLAKHYKALSVPERLRLIHDADRRGDSSERRKLKDAAKNHYELDDTGKLEAEMRNLFMYHHAEQLEIAAEFWFAHTRVCWAFDDLDEAASLDPKQEDNEKLDYECRFWLSVVKITETKYVIERDGWNLFIQQTGFDQERLDRTPKSWLLDYMDEHVRVHADAIECLQWMKKSDEPYILKTAESVANGWHQTVAEMLAMSLNGSTSTGY